MSFKNKIKISTLAILCSIASMSYATGEGAYVGLQLGYGNLNNLHEDINTGQPLPPPPTPPHPCDSEATCYIVDNVAPTNTGLAERLFFGANINKYFALEFGVANYEPSSYEPDVAKDSDTHEPHIWEYSADILGKVMLPLDRFTLFLKGGGAFVYKSTSSAVLTDGFESSSGDETFFSLAYGAGVSWDITPNWVIDATFQRIQQTDDLQAIDFYGVGLSYHFVEEYCGQFLC
jgi:opacity protein-like surface antigen